MTAMLVFFAIALVGMTLIIVDSKIMGPFRDWAEKENVNFLAWKLHDIVTCAQCCGFWVGLWAFPIIAPFLDELSWNHFQIMATPALAILSGCAISVLAMLTNVVKEWLLMATPVPWGDMIEKGQDEETTN